MKPDLDRFSDAINELADRDKRIAELERQFTELNAEVADQQFSFDLRWKADMRAIKRWQEATGRTLVWPDHADLCVWLMERIAGLESHLAALLLAGEPLVEWLNQAGRQDYPDERPVLYGDVTVGHFRALAAALANECGGTGVLVNDGPRSICGDCSGTGAEFPGNPRTEKCLECDGTGRVTKSWG